MTRTVANAFEAYLRSKTPTAAQRAAAARHRGSVERSISTSLGVHRFIETGSFSHGTGVAGFSDVDLLVSLNGSRPTASDTALRWVRACLAGSFPNTYVRVSRPAVVVPFAQGYETFEVIPGFVNDTRAEHRYSIPAPGGDWIDSTPEAHLKYVSDVERSVAGAKRLARLLKAWKYHNSVPISSFYLEMRAAEHMATQTGFLPVWDLSLVLAKLDEHRLAPMPDPTGNTGLIRATSSLSAAIEARSKVHTAAVRAREAQVAYSAGEDVRALVYLDLLFNGGFSN